MTTAGKEVGFAICVNNAGYLSSLELNKIYKVLPDEEAGTDNDLRVVDESGIDYLYPASYFVPVKPPQTVERHNP